MVTVPTRSSLKSEIKLENKNIKSKIIMKYTKLIKLLKTWTIVFWVKKNLLNYFKIIRSM